MKCDEENQTMNLGDIYIKDKLGAAPRLYS